MIPLDITIANLSGPPYTYMKYSVLAALEYYET